MSVVVAYSVSVAIMLILSSSSPSWAQMIVFSFIHIVIGYLLPLVLTIRAVHNEESESFHSTYLTYFVFLFAILEPFSNIIRRIHNYPLAFQLLIDVFILWLLLPKSQGIRHVHSILTNKILHSYSWKMIEKSLTTGILRQMSDFVTVKIYPVVVQYLISNALRLQEFQPSSNHTPTIISQQSLGEYIESDTIIDLGMNPRTLDCDEPITKDS